MKGGRERALRLLACALVAVTPLTAGCLDAAGSTWHDVRASVGLPADEVPAKSAADEAEDAAGAWNASARLHNAFAAEWRRGDGPGEPQHNRSFPEDPEVGNGKAPAWSFEYVTPEAKLRVLVYANRTVSEEVKKGDFRDAYEEAGAAPEWRVDSDDAMDALRKRDDWRDGADGARTVFDTLGRNETVTAWVFVALDPAWEGVVGIVDATTGEVEDVFRWNASSWGGRSWNWSWSWSGSGPGSWGSWSWGGGNVTFEETYEGELTRLDPQDRHPFPVAAAGQTIEVVLREAPVSANSVQVRILGPDGEEVPLKGSTDGAFGQTVEHPYTAEAREAGEHTLVVALKVNGAYAEYEAELTVGTGRNMESGPPRIA